MTGNFEQFLTEKGKQHYDFFRKHDLGRFYEPMMGNLAIEEDDWPAVKETVLKFITEYWEGCWTLSYHGQMRMWFVTQSMD